MMNKTTYGLVIIVGIVLSVACWHSQSYLVVRTDTWECHWATDSFVLEWRHSVERQLWQEHYRHNNGQLLLSHSFVQSFGAGVPSDGTPIVAPKGFVGSQHNLTVPQINWVVSSRMQGTLIDPTTNAQFAIYRTVPDYTPVYIASVQKNSVKHWLDTLKNANADCQTRFVTL